MFQTYEIALDVARVTGTQALVPQALKDTHCEFSNRVTVFG